jgi:copper chaperone CopZ
MMMPGTTRSVLLIAGMRTIGCGKKIATALESVAGVTRADVDFWSARATVVHRATCNASQLIAAVIAAGYTASLAGAASDDAKWSGRGISGWSDAANP